MSQEAASATPNDQSLTEDNVASFDVDLYEVGVGDSGYRTRNNPNQPYERETVTYRKAFRCESRAVTHGKLSAESEHRATLLVYDFDFHPPLRHRVTSLCATFTFHGQEIEVVEFAPRSLFTYGQSSQNESRVRGGQGRAGFSQSGAELSGSWKDETTTERTTNDSAAVQGYFTCDDFGTKTGVKWELEENHSTKKGIPTFLRTALLLQRSNDTEFKGSVDFKVKTTDWKSEIRHFLGRRDVDEPVLYDPTKTPTKNSDIAGLNINNLGSLRLEDLFKLISHTTVDGAVKVMEV